MATNVESANEKATRRVQVLTRTLTAGTTPSVIAFGSVCADNFWYFKDLPLGGVEKDQFFKMHVGAKIPCTAIEEAIGGSAANVATGLVKLGIPATLFCAIGEDGSGKSGVAALEARGVNTAGVVVVPGSRTDQSTIVRSTNNNDRTILTYKGAMLGPDNVRADLVKDATLFMWTSVAAKQPIEAIKKCIKVANQNGVKVAAAPSQAMIVTHPQDMLELLSGTHVLSLNDTEIMLLTKTTTLQAAISAFLTQFPQMEMLQVTRGKYPSILVSRLKGDEIRVVKTVPPDVKIVDKTGAGDAAGAGLLYAYLMKVTPEVAAKMSATTSTSKIMNKGAAAGLLNAGDLNRLLHTYKFEQTSITTTLKGLLEVPDKHFD